MKVVSSINFLSIVNIYKNKYILQILIIAILFAVTAARPQSSYNPGLVYNPYATTGSGSYQYVDANGNVQTNNYHVDANLTPPPASDYGVSQIH